MYCVPQRAAHCRNNFLSGCNRACRRAVSSAWRQLESAPRRLRLLERLFGEERRRTKVIPHAFAERAVLKLMYAALIRASQTWRRVVIKRIRIEADRRTTRPARQRVQRTNDCLENATRVPRTNLQQAHGTWPSVPVSTVHRPSCLLLTLEVRSLKCDSISSTHCRQRQRVSVSLPRWRAWGQIERSHRYARLSVPLAE